MKPILLFRILSNWFLNTFTELASTLFLSISCSVCLWLEHKPHLESGKKFRERALEPRPLGWKRTARRSRQLLTMPNLIAMTNNTSICSFKNFGSPESRLSRSLKVIESAWPVRSYFCWWSMEASRIELRSYLVEFPSKWRYWSKK